MKLISISLILVAIICISTTYEIPNKHNLSIISSSEEFITDKIHLTNSKTELIDAKHYKFYVLVKTKKVSGKKYHTAYKKVKRKGVKYKLKYVYEYLPSSKKMFDKQAFIVWEDGEIDHWENHHIVSVENIRLQVQLNEISN